MMENCWFPAFWYRAGVERVGSGFSLRPDHLPEGGTRVPYLYYRHLRSCDKHFGDSQTAYFQRLRGGLHNNQAAASARWRIIVSIRHDALCQCGHREFQWLVDKSWISKWFHDLDDRCIFIRQWRQVSTSPTVGGSNFLSQSSPRIYLVRALNLVTLTAATENSKD